MRVTRLRLRDFRTYARGGGRARARADRRARARTAPARRTCSRRSTSAAPARSCRTANEREVVRFGAERRAASRSTRERRRRRARARRSASSPARPKRLQVDGAPVERLTDAAGAAARLASSCPTGWSSCKGAPALRRAHLDQVVAALWPARAGDAPRLRARAGAAQRAAGARSAPARAGARLAAGLGRRARPPRRRADGRPRRGASSGCAARFAAHAEELGLDGRGRAALPAALDGRRRRGAGRASWPSARDADLERGFTGHGPHRDDLVLPPRRAASCAPTARGPAAPRRCWRCCWPSARRWPPTRGAAPLMLLDDVMSELDRDRRERLVDAAARAAARA